MFIIAGLGLLAAYCVIMACLVLGLILRNFLDQARPRDILLLGVAAITILFIWG